MLALLLEGVHGTDSGSLSLDTRITAHRGLRTRLRKERYQVSRDVRPAGSQPPFGAGNVAWRLNPYRGHYYSTAFACSDICLLSDN